MSDHSSALEAARAWLISCPNDFGNGGGAKSLASAMDAYADARVRASESFLSEGVCMTCGRPPSFQCREHFVKERDALRERAERAEAQVADCHKSLAYLDDIRRTADQANARAERAEAAAAQMRAALEWTRNPEAWSARVALIYDAALATDVGAGWFSPEAAAAQADARERGIRKALWLSHGHTAALYGDDGEMQCNACEPCGDYKRAPIADVVKASMDARVVEALEKALAEASTEQSAWETLATMATGHSADACLVGADACRKVANCIRALARKDSK